MIGTHERFITRGKELLHDCREGAIANWRGLRFLLDFHLVTPEELGEGVTEGDLKALDAEYEERERLQDRADIASLIMGIRDGLSREESEQLCRLLERRRPDEILQNPDAPFFNDIATVHRHAFIATHGEQAFIELAARVESDALTQGSGGLCLNARACEVALLKPHWIKLNDLPLRDVVRFTTAFDQRKDEVLARCDWGGKSEAGRLYSWQTLQRTEALYREHPDAVDMLAVRKVAINFIRNTSNRLLSDPNKTDELGAQMLHLVDTWKLDDVDLKVGTGWVDNLRKLQADAESRRQREERDRKTLFAMAILQHNTGEDVHTVSPERREEILVALHAEGLRIKMMLWNSRSGIVPGSDVSALLEIHDAIKKSGHTYEEIGFTRADYVARMAEALAHQLRNHLLAAALPAFPNPLEDVARTTGSTSADVNTPRLSRAELTRRVNLALAVDLVDKEDLRFEQFV